MRQVALPGGTLVPAIGQGTWRMGEGGRSLREEADALRLGIDLGMTLIDTAEMYGDGAAEEVVGHAIVGQRDRAFVVTKVYPHNASRTGVPAACARSLRRLSTDVIDLYLLHWRGGVPLAETVGAFERLRREGKIRHWGVSNLGPADMNELVAVTQGRNCAANQVLYSPEHRGIEFDLLPWQARVGMPVMAYSPVGQGGRLLCNAALAAVARRHGASPAQIAIAWGLRHTHVISIPKAADMTHVRQNAAAADIVLSAADLAEIDAAYPPPTRATHLAML